MTIDYDHLLKVIEPPEWEVTALMERYASLSGSIRRGLAPLSALLAHQEISFDAQNLKAIYGDLDHPNHIFKATPLDWGFPLSETQVTRGLAHFLAQPETKVRRLRAFLTAFGVTPPKDDDILEQAEVGAETNSITNDRRGRIDLEILFDAVSPSSRTKHTHQRALIIEAKLGHSVTREQIKNYLSTVRKRIVEPKYFILAQYEGDEEKLHHKQRTLWSVVYWDDILKSFEKELLTVGENDDDFRLFRRTLWERVEGSNRKRGR